MYIVGIDPGQHGAYCLFDDNKPIEVNDLVHVDGMVYPVPIGTMIDEKEFIEDDSEVLFVIEQQIYIPPGGKGAFTNGVNYGMILEFCTNLCRTRYSYSMTFPSPSAWKRMLALAKKGKEGSLALAVQMWPAFASQLVRGKKPSHDRAEAMLLALYGWYKYRKNGV